MELVLFIPFYDNRCIECEGSIFHLLGLTRGKIPAVMAIVDDDAAGQGRNKKSREYEEHE
jgi:hypothetical protein